VGGGEGKEIEERFRYRRKREVSNLRPF
jgi:hypothetical protein